MKLKTTTSIMFSALFIFAFAVSVEAQAGAYANGKAAGLSALQIANLKKLKAAIGVPTYIPVGFKLVSMTIEEPPEPGIIDYSIVYSNARGQSFTIQSANDGIGDVSEPRLFGRNPYFSDRVQAGYTGDDEDGLFASWIGSKRAYQPRGSIQQFYSLVADKGDLTLREAVKIMASLRYLKR